MSAKEEQQISELQLDIDEIKNLLETQAKRANVKLLLNAWVEKLNMEKENLKLVLESQKPKKIV